MDTVSRVTAIGRGAARALLLSLLALVGWLPAAGAAPPLFTFAQISDSQPTTASEWTLFEKVLDTIVAAGAPGALVPQPVDFVLFAGDLVFHPSRQSEWLQWVNTINARLTANGIPYRAVPGNHDQDSSGIGNYEFYVGDSRPWDTDSATIVGNNGRSVSTGWSGLHIVGFNNSNGGYGIISAADVASIATRVSAAAAANANVLLLAHHAHNDQGPIPLASVLPNPAIVGYLRGHSGNPGAKKGLSGVSNPNVWELHSNAIVEEGALFYYEVYATELRVYILQMVNNPTALPAVITIALPHALVPVVASVPTADFSAAPVSGAAPLAVTFSDLSTGSPTAWSWSFGDGATSTLQNPSHSYATPGVYDVRLTASNTAGPNAKTRVGYVSVLPPSPTTTFVPDADARVSSGSPTSSFGSDSVLRIRGGASVYQSYLRFAVSGIASQSVISAKLRLFATDPSDSGGSLYTVDPVWTESGITWSTAPTISGTPLASQGAAAANQWVEYDVTSTVRGDGTFAFGLTSASSDSLYLSSREGANPPQLVLQTAASSTPVAAFGAAPTAGSAPLAVVFTDLSTGGPTSWLWTFGDGSTSVVKSPSHTYDAAGIYDVSLRVANASGSNTLSRSAFIQASAAVAPTADFSGTPLAGVAPLAVTFTDLSAGNPTAWSWSFGDGGTSTARNPSHTYMAAGSYSVSLTASNALGPSTKLRSAYVIASTGLPVTTFESVADAKVSQASPTLTYGTATDLRLRTSTASWRSFVRFSVAGITKPVARATLRLWVTDASSDVASLYGVANTWSEGVTWTTAPEIAGTPIASFGSPTAGVWVEVDVTARVTGNGSYDFGLVNADTDSAIYSSREGVHPPQLVVETLP